ncbi:Dfp1/Him1, central region-domain-containing protein [Chaetomium sp. MPI-SDFR-AT-0129]|nr:Dfp1/Him1, central region-domain-containing protein [Chaetomium sp. MPI-SDFR-AT-0129]
MSTRRVPLSTTNPNVANSPMRAAAIANGIKKSRSHADAAREDVYGQPPPAKRQMVERGVASPSRVRTTRTVVHRTATRATANPAATQKESTAATIYPEEADEEEQANLRTWYTQIRARFPKMVFYFESVPDDTRARLAKQVARLHAREEKFFSIDITHIVTTRPIPPDKSRQERERALNGQGDSEQPKTIDPALLNRPVDVTRRRLTYDSLSGRKPSALNPNDPLRRPKMRSTDILDRARDMGKKIWSLEKLVKILEIALKSDPCTKTEGRASTQSTNKQPAEPTANLAKLLQEERVSAAVSNKELHSFKGVYIYVYDVEERTKPIMVREYPKASEPKDQEWPQFRVASQGRCPFIYEESCDAPEKEDRELEAARARARAKVKAARAAAEKQAEQVMPKPRASEIPSKATTGKRTLTEMEDGHNRGTTSSRTAEPLDRAKVSNPPSFEFRSQNAFISHAKAGRFLAGEPVASGLQASNITSAIRSQMISSTTGGVLGAKAGTSKEIHGLQRKVVLQKASNPALSQDLSSRRLAEMSHDSNACVRSASISQTSQRRLGPVDEEGMSRQREKLRRTASVPVSQPRPKRDPKPGYCENCQDKFADFDEHIVSRKHRKFAENNDNWTQLDSLLSQLRRVPRY